MQVMGPLASLALVAAVCSSFGAAAPVPLPAPAVAQIALVKRGADAGVHARAMRQVDFERIHAHLARLQVKYNRVGGRKHHHRHRHHHKHGKSKHGASGTSNNGTATTTHHARDGSAKGVVSLTDEKEQLWAGQVDVAGQKMMVDFDTGSGDFIANKYAYTPSNSTTSQRTGQTFSDSYGDGSSATGPIYLDRVSVGGLVAPNATIGRASDDTFISTGADALAGMGLPQLSAFPQQKPLWQTLVDVHAMPPVFSMHLTRSAGSTLTLGAPGKAPKYVPLSSDEGYWQVSGTLGGQQLEAVIDSGTTLIVLPTDVATALFQANGMDARKEDDTLYGAFDCASPPSVSLELKGVTVPVVDINLGQDADGKCLATIVGQDISGSGSGSAVAIVGDPIFTSVDSITFDAQRKAVGFSL